MQKKDQKTFVFLAHWVENWNWLLWWSKTLHQKPENAWRWMWLWPMCTFMSLVYLFGKRAYDIVDEFSFNGALDGKTLLVRNFGWHFFVKGQKGRIKQRILKAVIDAQDDGAEVIGLGALIKAEWLTTGGKWVVDQLGDKLKVPIVHGDTLTAAGVIQQVHRLIRKFNISTPVFITGATSKIGRAVALALVTKDIPVVLLTNSRKRFNRIQQEAGLKGDIITKVKSLSGGKSCQLWVTGKAVPSGKTLLGFVPNSAIVLNFSVPNPLSAKHLKRRPDIYSVEGGLVAYDPSRTDLRFTMRLWPGITYACHAGTMVHARLGWKHHEVSQVDLKMLSVVWKAASDLGFRLPDFPPEPQPKLATNKKSWMPSFGKVAHALRSISFF